MNVTLDGIVFGLQRYGGISNYWDRLSRHVGTVPDVRSQVVLPSRVRYAELDRTAWPNTIAHTESMPTAISRYIDVGIATDCDVFHTSYFRAPSRRRARYVVTVYDFIYERFVSGLARTVHSYQKHRSISLADAVICISNATRDDVSRFMPDIDVSKVHVVHLGVDRTRFFPEPSEQDGGLESTVLYVGQRRGYKRFDLAVEALARCDGLSLGMVGPEPSSAEVNLLDSRLRGRWRSFGLVSSDRLRQLYSSVFAFIFPSDYEGFGLPILEAMACGCPVVAARTSSLPEVGGGVASYAVEQLPEHYTAAFARLQISPEVRRLAKEAGQRRAEEFSWERTFEQTLAIYRGEPPQ